MIPFASKSIPNADWGYRFRSGKRGHYRYWYRDDVAKAYYEGHKPSLSLINRNPVRLRTPNTSQIVANPWENYTQANPELIYSRHTPSALMNYFGMTDVDELELHEDLWYTSTIQEAFRVVKTDTQMSIQFILNLHKGIFGKIYPWAGRYRTVTLSKDKFRWPPAVIIDREMAQYEHDILHRVTPARFSDDRIYEDAAKVAGDLLIIHPFREGNGRIAKLLAALLILQAELPLLDVSSIGKEQLVNAALDAYAKNYTPLSDLLRASTSRE